MSRGQVRDTSIREARFLLKRAHEFDRLAALGEQLEGTMVALWADKDSKRTYFDQKKQARAKRAGTPPPPDLSRLSKPDRAKLARRGGIVVTKPAPSP